MSIHREGKRALSNFWKRRTIFLFSSGPLTDFMKHKYYINSIALEASLINA
jgi:hypothetical protein